MYGIYPYPISNDDLSRMHGNDERVPIDSLEQGTDLIYEPLFKSPRNRSRAKQAAEIPTNHSLTVAAL